MEPRKASRPDLSVVIVVAGGSFDTIRKTIRHLREQTVQERLEVVIVTPSAAQLALDEQALEGFFGHRVVEVGPLPSIDRARASGVRRARAPIVALVEDHAYPAPNWAEALLTAYQQGPWSAVGTPVANANPQTARSWATFLLSYGAWAAPEQGGEVEDLPGHNVSYRREVLAAYGPALENKLERESGLHQELRAQGHRLYLTPDAKIYHVNPSLISSMVTLFFGMGRLYGARRARENHWSPLQRALYIGGAPLIPLVRFYRLRTERADLKKEHQNLSARLIFALLLALVADAVGQAMGYAAGPGRMLRMLDHFEVGRMRHITEAERRALQPQSELA